MILRRTKGFSRGLPVRQWHHSLHLLEEVWPLVRFRPETHEDPLAYQLEAVLRFDDRHVKWFNAYKPGEMTFRYDTIARWK